MTDRFDLEQQILDCWQITQEIPMMESQGASAVYAWKPFLPTAYTGRC